MATSEQNLQVQIDQIQAKLDRLLESMELQDRRREEIDDLVEDLNIVAKDAFQQSVVLLDKSGVELDSCGISCLVIKILQNIGTFREMLDLMESARDFMKDISPVLHQIGLDAVNKLHDLEQKGYFEYLAALSGLAEKWVRTYTADDIRHLQDNLENLAGILRNLSDPALAGALNRATRVLTEVKMDDRLDDKSLWKIFLQLRSPEVRKSLSYSLRLIQAMQTNNSQV
ncbi:MAG TPA: hypothetical protein VMC08_00450 [Bacteroidales bacterium]|nr:hypothetical protein [Bacteroidales bacterium]